MISSLWTVEIGRLCIPLLIFAYPLLAELLSLTLDQTDGQLFYQLGYKWKTYNTIDKMLDFWWYIFILLFLRGSHIFLIASMLFLWRMIGQVWGIVGKNETIYIFFPNLLEWVFVQYVLFPHMSILIMILISGVWSLFLEWAIHKKHIHLMSKYVLHNEIKWKQNEH